MPIPRAVREQAERAERMLAEHQAQQQQNAEAVAETESAPEAEQTAEPVAAEPETTAPPDEESALVLTGDESVDPLTALQLQEELERERQRRKTLEGKYNAEVVQAKQAHKELERRIAELQEEIETLRGVNTQAEVTAAQMQVTQALGKLDDVIQQYQSTFDADTLKLVRDAAAAAVEEAVNASELKVAQIREQLKPVEQRVKSTADAAIAQALDSRIPDWRQLNSDPGFLEWVGQTDPQFGMSRQQALDAALAHAESTGDVQTAVDRIVAIFSAYPKRKAPSVAPPASTTTPAAPESLSPTITPQNSKPYITQDFIRKFSEDVAKGRYRNRPSERVRIQEMIDAAIRENRIR